MCWLYLLIAGLSEIGWAVVMKYSEGFSKLLPSFFTIFLMLISFGFLSLALKGIPLGTAYAVWTGIGTAGTFILGIFLLHESVSVLQGVCVLSILSGVIGLKFLS
ncbi:MAG: multidrug efflux SMR transporter [Succinivibrio sp.]|nr:multidrug efflux SMR transporter [Succinivibrio sp.]